MKRRIAIALALLLALAAPARAESDARWSREGDWYVHAAQNCGGVEGRSIVPPGASQEPLRESCPLCAPWSGGRSVRAFRLAEANLLLICVPDALLARIGEEAEFEPAEGERAFEGEDAWNAAGEYLNGEALRRFLADLRETGSAEAEALVPLAFDSGDALRKLLSSRHLGGAWYLLYRVSPSEEPQVKLRVSVRRCGLRMEGSRLRCDAQGRAVSTEGALRLVEQSADVALEADRGDLLLRVLRMRGMYLAQVVRRSGGGAEVELCIEGGAPISLAGFPSGGAGVSACVMTRTEARALLNGAGAELREAQSAEEE